MRFILLLLILLPFTAQAQGLEADSKQPIDIAADSLQVLQKDEVAVFTGNVEAVQGKTTLNADKMTVHYKSKKEKKSGNGVSKIIVEGNVVLKTPTETAEGNKGIYEVDAAKVILEGSVVLRKQDNVLKGNRLVYSMNSGKSELFSAASAAGKKGADGRVRGTFIPGQ